MPTDLAALAMRKRHASRQAKDEQSAMLASLVVCLAVLVLMFAFPTLANSMASLGLCR
jgi:hypothetical protein